MPQIDSSYAPPARNRRSTDLSERMILAFVAGVIIGSGLGFLLGVLP